MNAMFDLHAHILPGLDDGAEDWKAAVAMCRRARADGVRGIVATPHFHRGLFATPDVETVQARCMELQEYCEKALVKDFRVYMGSDCRLHPQIVDNLEAGRIPTINGGRYLLLELPDDSLPPRLDELLFQIRLKEVVPIITHPERNDIFIRHPGLLQDLIEAGVYAQVTAGSLTGLFGSRVQDAAQEMLERRLVQMIASDAHDPERRPPVLSEAREAAARIVGKELAGKMVEEVPGAVLKDEPIRFPEPLRPASGFKPWWEKVFGKGS